MSKSLATSFPVGTVDATLTDIENRCKGPNGSSTDDVTVGPFGVINFNKTPTEQDAEKQAPVQEEAVIDPMPPSEEQQLLDQVTPLTIDSWMGLDDTLQWADLFGFGHDPIFPPSDGGFEPMLDVNGGTDMLYQPQNPSMQTGVDQPMPSAYNALAGSGSRLTPLDTDSVNLDDVLAEGQLLLKHFKDNVIARFMSLPITAKSPWEIIVFSESINTLAHLTFLTSTNVSCAKRATLFGVLAMSAFHLSKNPSFDVHPSRQVGNWEQVQRTSSLEAKQNLQRSLKEELQGYSKAKYKDQLMAILTLLAFSVSLALEKSCTTNADILIQAISGCQKEARCYLIDAERLLRHRGLAKREISRRARLLHHVYTWCRIVGESTYVLHDKTAGSVKIPSQKILAPVPSTSEYHSMSHTTGPGSRLDDFLRVEPHFADSDLDIEELKEPQASLRDIHLQDARENPDTMYTQIYGISETWLSLLSQTTRLANSMDGAKVAKSNDAARDDILRRRAARLEDMVCSFASQFAPHSTSFHWMPNHHMHRALNSALVIFFYRRIRNVNSWILQSHVDDVIAALESFDQSISEKTWEGPGSPWAAFIAGCEASTPAKRERLLQWVENGAAMTGFDPYVSAKSILLELWQRRDENQQLEDISSSGSRASSRRSRGSQNTTSWVDLCREQKIWLMVF